MKNKTVILLSVLMILLSSCKKETNWIELDEYIESKPDSVMSLLRSKNIKKLSESEYAHWCLLVVKAKERKQLSLLPDSFLHTALSFYKRDKSNLLLTAYAYYYAAKIRHELKDAESTIKYLYESKACAQSQGDCKLLFLITKELQTLYMEQGLYKKQFVAAKQSLDYASSLQDSLLLSESLYNMGVACRNRNKSDTALFFLRKALEMDVAKKNQIYYHISNIHKSKGNYEEALEYSEMIRQMCSKVDLLKGEIYKDFNQYDSAVFYLNKCANSVELQDRAWSAVCLGEVYKKSGNPQKAIECYETYALRLDSMNRINKAVAVIEMQERLQTDEIVEGNQQLRREKEQIQVWIYKICLLATILLLLGICYYFYSLKKRQKQAYLIEKEINETKNLLNQQEIENLHKDKSLALVRENFLTRLIAMNLPKLNEHEENKVLKFSEQDFLNLEENINSIFDKFSERLSRQYPLLKREDVLFCCLLKAHIDLNTLANIYCRSKAAITKRKQRIKLDKIGLNDEKVSLDDFIRSF